MSATDMFREAFAGHRKALEILAEKQIRRTFADAVENYGPQLKNYNSLVWSNTLRYVVSFVKNSPFDFRGTAYLDEAKLAAYLANWSEAELTAAVTKLTAKVGNLTDVKITAGDATSWFVVTGKHPNGSDVKVTQTQKINFSSRGLMFNQWPALITVNGKRVSETAYQKIV